MSITFFNAARAEICSRLQLRDQTLLAWVTAGGVALGFALKDKPINIDVLKFIPILALPFSVALFRHNFIITHIGDFIHHELNDFLGVGTEGAPLHWDTSKTLHRIALNFLVLEALVHMVFLAAYPLSACGICFAACRGIGRAYFRIGG